MSARDTYRAREAWNDGDYMRTYTGKKWYPMEPERLIVDIEDIAHALSQMNRYCGHLKEFYSVAQHSLLVEQLVTRRYLRHYKDFQYPHNFLRKLQLQALLHDATEAYLPDMPSPIKKILPDFKRLEKRLQRHIFAHFDLPQFEHAFVKEMDAAIRGSEIHCLTDWEEGSQIDTLHHQIVPLPPTAAEAWFLSRFHELWP